MGESTGLESFLSTLRLPLVYLLLRLAWAALAGSSPAVKVNVGSVGSQAEGQAEGAEALALLAFGVTLGSGFRNPTDYLSERAWVQIMIVPLLILVPIIST